jgi:hypothetical protein
MLGPLDGPQMSQMRATLCVISSIALVALSGSDLTGGLRLGTLSVAGLSTIMGSILDMVAVSWDVEGTSCKELGWHINSCLLCLFTALARSRHFASLVFIPRGYKADGHPYTQPTSSRMISHCIPTSFPTWLKRKRDRETYLEIRGSC